MIRKLLIVVVAVLTMLGIGLYGYAHTPLPMAQSPVAFELKAGSSLIALTGQMQAADALPPGVLDALRFRMLARLSGEAGRIKAGFYVLTQPLTPLQLLNKLVRGEVTPRQIRFIEGWTFSQMRGALDAYPWIQHTTQGMTDAEIVQTLGMSESSPEGWFFPDTYDIASGNTDISILHRAWRKMQQHLQQAWETRAPDVPYKSPEEALIMASIIEKETGNAQERPHIAAFFINRLRMGMRLQTDPTVSYGMGSAFDGNLRKRDLQTDTPYNTYTRSGLPPTPIAMPGLASIEAAVHPDASKDLYFVSRGDGTHVFSQQLSDHNRAVARYQKQN